MQPKRSFTRWGVAILIAVVAIFLMTKWYLARREKITIEGYVTVTRVEPYQPRPTTTESTPNADSIPETTEPDVSPPLSPSTGPIASGIQPRIRSRTLRPSVSTTSPADMQPQPTSQAYVPGDAYVPPTTPGAPSPQPGAPAAAATPRILFTGDGNLLIVAAGGAVESCDLTSGQRHALGASIGDASVMTVSPDGRTIVTQDAGGTVHLFDAATWLAQAKTYSPGVAGVTAIALSPDGRTLALAGKGVAIWDLVDGKTRNTLHGNDACSSVSFSADGKSLAVATAEGATIWETTLWQKQITLGAGGGAGIVRFWRARSALGVAAADQTVRIYDLATNQVQTTLNAGAPISDFALSSDGRSVAATIGNGQLTVWDSATGVPRKLP